MGGTHGFDADGYDFGEQEELQSGRNHIHHHHHHHQTEAKTSTHALAKINETPSAASQHTLLDMVHSPTEKPYVRIHCKADLNYFLSVRDGKVILAPFHLYDHSQLWFKEEQFNTVTDEVAHFSFALVNKLTNEAMRHNAVLGHKSNVQLIQYDPQVLDETILWSQGTYRDDGYKSLRTVVNYKLNLDAHAADRSVRDGTPLVLSNWTAKSNQLWKIIHF